MYNKINMNFDYSFEKDLILKEIRGVGFEDVINSIKKRGVLDDIDHFNKKKYPNQRLYIVEISEYVYVVPYVTDKKRKVTFLKTIYPSRKLTKKYIKR